MIDDDVPSPCVRICVVDEARDICRGCYRTLDEIACWGTMSDEERQEVVEKLAERGDRSGAAEARDT